MGKKLARRWEDWGSSPRGRRRVRPHVRKAAARSLVATVALALVLVALLAMLGHYA